MAVFRYPFGGSVSETLNDIPPRGKTFFKQGFNILAKIPKDKWDDILQEAMETFDSGYSSEQQDLASKINITKEEAKTLLGTVSMAAAIMSSREETAEQFIEAAMNAKILEDANKNTVLAFLKAAINKRSTIKQALAHSTLGAEVLPSLDEFEMTVDVRLSYEKGRIEFAVPVAIVHIDTDAQHQEVWFQLTKRQVEKMVNDLQETLRRIQAAEKWIVNSLPTKE